MNRRWLQVLALIVLIVSLVAAVGAIGGPPFTPAGLLTLAALLLGMLLAALVLVMPSGETIVSGFEEGVTVRVPWQGRQVTVRKLPLGTLDDVRQEQSRLAAKPDPDDGFSPNRLVVNFEIAEADRPERALTEFKPPFTVRIAYSREDYLSAQRKKQPLQAAFFLGGRWIRFTESKHRFAIRPDPASPETGYVEATVARWGDPRIALGP
jgi:hypothetical protein